MLKFWNFSFARDLICSKCMTPYDDKDHTPISLLCPHTFCDACVQKLPSSKCPDCEVPFTHVTKNQHIIRCLHLAEAASKEKDNSQKENKPNSEEDAIDTIFRFPARSLLVEDDAPAVCTETPDENITKPVELNATVTESPLRRTNETSQLPTPPPMSLSSGYTEKKATAETSSTPPPPMCQFCKESPVTSICQDCVDVKSLCDDCFAFRHRKGVMAAHSKVSWVPKLVSKICPEHDQECLVFCKLCSMSICTLCTLGGHKGHNLLMISEEESDCKTRLKVAIANLEAATKEIEVAAQSIEDKFVDITGTPYCNVENRTVLPQGRITAEAITNIETHFDKLKGLLDQRKAVLISHVHAACQEKADVLMQQLDRTSLYISRNYALSFQIKQLLENRTSAYVVEMESASMKAIAKQMEARHAAPVIPATTGDIQFVGNATGEVDIHGQVLVEKYIQEVGRVISKDVDPARCMIVGEALLRAVVVKQEVRLGLLLQDRQGSRFTAGGDVVSCLVRPVPTGDIVEDAVTVMDNDDGSYSMLCRFVKEGQYQMQVFVRGMEVASSPIDFHVSKSLRHGAIGAEGSGEGQLLNPTGVFCDGGMIYVSDQLNKRVQVFSTDGSYVWALGGWGRGRRQLQCVSGIYLYGGMLYVSDSQNHRIHVFDRDGAYVRYVGGRGDGEGQLQNPEGICCCDDMLYVCDSANSRVQVYTCEGHFVRSIGNTNDLLLNPTGICCDKDTIYVCDSDNDRVQVFSIAGKFIRSLGGWGSGTGQLVDPSDVCICGGLVCVSDRGNHRIQVYDRHGIFVKTIQQWRDGRVDGLIQQPQGICSAEGLLYVSDISDHKVYIINFSTHVSNERN